LISLLLLPGGHLFHDVWNEKSERPYPQPVVDVLLKQYVEFVSFMEMKKNNFQQFINLRRRFNENRWKMLAL